MSNDFWTNFEAGVARAELALPELAADLMLLARIVADPEKYALNAPGELAGYLARVAEALRHDQAARRSARR